VPDAFAGAPLDVIKLVAAGLMVVDHVNYVFFGHVANLMWYLGRPVFPLFVFVLACHLMRGTATQGYVEKLIVLAVVSQPFYATLLNIDMANPVFTLAAGAVLVIVLRPRHPIVQHLVFLAATVVIFASSLRVREGLDYGLAGTLLPAALYLVLDRRWSHTLWLAVLIFALNWYPGSGWKLRPDEVAFVAAGGAVLIALVALALKGRPRFLPRYAFYIFYPAHLLVLLLVHRWL
jgi:TraX protein